MTDALIVPVSPELRAAVGAAARDAGVTVEQFVRVALEAVVAARPKPPASNSLAWLEGFLQGFPARGPDEPPPAPAPSHAPAAPDPAQTGGDFMKWLGDKAGR